MVEDLGGRIEAKGLEDGVCDLITETQIKEYKQDLLKNWKIELGEIPIIVARPGDDLYAWYETIFRLEVKFGIESTTEVERIVGEKLEKGDDFVPGSLTPADLVRIREMEEIELKGVLPGLSLVDDNPFRLVFFSVKEENVREIAAREVEKAGKEMSFDSIPEAVAYLKGLAKDLFFHEAGHFVYERWKSDGSGKPGKQERWDAFMGKSSEMLEEVRKIQQKNYPDIEISKETLFEEAFAEYFQEVVTRGEVKSRLGKNDGANELVG